METIIKPTNNLIQTLKGKNKVLSIYFTAGYPQLYDTSKLVFLLQGSGVDLIEIGIPFADSLMDGPVIQESNAVALKNGMTLKLLLEELMKIKDQIRIPIVLMGSYNSALKYGMEQFCKSCENSGIAGVLFPEMPPEEYQENYLNLFTSCNLASVFMISPRTSPERLRFLDALTNGFIYVLSSNSTTGNEKQTAFNTKYFEKLRDSNFLSPTMTGFNIKTPADFEMACQFTNEAIIGSEFVKLIAQGIDETKIKDFIKSFR